MGQCISTARLRVGACLPCSLHGKIFNIAGFVMWERGFNAIISWMMVSRYSAVPSHTGREGCLLLLFAMALTFVDHDTPYLILLLFLGKHLRNSCCRLNAQIKSLEGKALYVCVSVCVFSFTCYILSSKIHILLAN